MSVTNPIEIKSNTKNQTPKNQGLYDKRNEKDACGVGFVAHIKGKKSHEIVQQGLTLLTNLTHRGATGYDPKLGDGAGLLMQMPDAFMREEDERARLDKSNQKAKEEGQTELIIEMYLDNISIERISKIAKLTVERVKQIIDSQPTR